MTDLSLCVLPVQRTTVLASNSMYCCLSICCDDEQKSIVVEDLSPLAMYALRNADLMPQPAAADSRHYDDDDDVDDDQTHVAAAADDDDGAEQVLFTDDDIQVMMCYITYTALWCVGFIALT